MRLLGGRTLGDERQRAAKVESRAEDDDHSWRRLYRGCGHTLNRGGNRGGNQWKRS